MEVSPTPQFAAKIDSFRGDPGTLGRLASLISELEKSSDRKSAFESMPRSLESMGSDIFVLRSGDVRLFVSFETRENNEFVVLLDVALAGSRDFAAARPPDRNPQVNSGVNPLSNAQISPRYNAQLNPKFNAQINPQFNAQINPTFNAQINPQFNAQINPQFNAQINPQFNSALNPRFNSTINPRYNPAFGGAYLYDLSLNRLGYLVRANDLVTLVFDFNSELLESAVTNAIGGSTRFDRNNNWIGQFVPDLKGGLLTFSRDNEWIGFAV